MYSCKGSEGSSFQAKDKLAPRRIQSQNTCNSTPPIKVRAWWIIKSPNTRNKFPIKFQILDKVQNWNIGHCHLEILLSSMINSVTLYDDGSHSTVQKIQVSTRQTNVSTFVWFRFYWSHAYHCTYICHPIPYVKAGQKVNRITTPSSRATPILQYTILKNLNIGLGMWRSVF